MYRGHAHCFTCGGNHCRSGSGWVKVKRSRWFGWRWEKCRDCNGTGYTSKVGLDKPEYNDSLKD